MKYHYKNCLSINSDVSKKFITINEKIEAKSDETRLMCWHRDMMGIFAYGMMMYMTIWAHEWHDVLY